MYRPDYTVGRISEKIPDYVVRELSGGQQQRVAQRAKRIVKIIDGTVAQ